MKLEEDEVALAGEAPSKVSMYRHRDSAPMPLATIDNYLVWVLHCELKAIYGLLLDAADSLGISKEDTEKAIKYRIKHQTIENRFVMYDLGLNKEKDNG